MAESNKTKQNKKRLIEAMEKSLGVVSVACKAAKVSRKTFYEYMKDDKEFAEAITDTENIALDFAESKLHERINKGNVAAIIFYLKTKGKKRGYVEKQEIDMSSNGFEIVIESKYKKESEEE